MIEKNKSKILVVGLVRNCSSTIEKEVKRLKYCIDPVKSLHWFLVESDSSDGTISKLNNLCENVENFNYVSLGNLIDKFPLRTERLSYCRNLYVKEIRENYKQFDYIIVSDLDNVNNKLKKYSISSCWVRNDWDMCSSNQKGPYYDIWALRHNLWCPNDFREKNSFLDKVVKDKFENLNTSLYSQMITINPKADWIEVDSSFGGLAIYRRKVFELGEYKGINDFGNEVCEHVYFHRTLKKFGCKLYINPKLITANYTDHSKYKLTFYSIILKIKSIILPLTNSIFGKNRQI